MRINDITYRIIGAAFRVHSEQGPGLLESAYQRCLALEMTDAGLEFLREEYLPLMHKGQPAGKAYRADFLVEDRVIIEAKAVERVEPIHRAQLLTYLKVAGCTAGLLLNFNEQNMRNGIHRVVLGYDDDELVEET